ncbi:AMP-binding protein [Sphingosinicella sp. CPCC 101087]|uniref:AMP-binding protein n=1 Tax=Sphingosinicella sp. CPCC 101087 TaxID=2497754 RepID=UPI00101CC2E0|nr:AMP-binding protein [Sphingosinicella sp. CPCC 101087]
MIAATIDPVSTHARTQPGAPACTDLETGRCWTYSELDRDVGQTAAWLAQRLGPASGERVATIARNCAEMLILQLACLRAGAIFVPLNWRLSPAELGRLATDAAPAMLFHDAEFDPVGAGERHPICALSELVRSAPPAPPPDSRRPWEETATLLYTSGTSGRPKGVILTAANAFFGCTNFILGNDVGRGSVFLCDMPLFHVAGLFAATLTPIMAGGSVLISRGFDSSRTLARLADRTLGVSHYFCVPQMAQRLWQEPGFEPDMLRGLSRLATGGAPNPAALVERFILSGIAMSNGFGMSETGSNFGVPVDDPELQVAKAGTCGLPYISVEARIVDEKGDDLTRGETGELWIAGPSVTPGYWNRPEENEKAFCGRWFRTGDAAYLDKDGYLFIVDRRKDMFISGGENVYPAEIEAALAEMEAIAEAAVIGVPDERWGEVGRAYVIPRNGEALEPGAVAAYCRSRLAKYKVPASIVVTDSLPRTASGKVQKHVLRERALGEMEGRHA